jgi:hypothetical protein
MGREFGLNFACKTKMWRPIRTKAQKGERKGVGPARGAVRRERRGDFTGVGIGSRGPDPSPAVRPPPGAMETAHEVAIYIDRFHNLDLFHQG